jgi:sporulation protein YtfJ
MADSNLSKLTETTLESIKKITDVNTVIGEPISVAGGTTIIPVSKISMGFTSGGIDYNSKKAPEKAPNFGGGTGTGFTILPIAFLVIEENGNVRLINAENSGINGGGDLIGAISGLVDKAPTFIEKIVKIFKKDKDVKNNADDKDPVGVSTVLNNEDLDDMEVE